MNLADLKTLYDYNYWANRRILDAAEGLTADQAQVRLLSRALLGLARGGRLSPLFEAPPEAAEEGWILGAGHAPLLAEALAWA